MQILAACLVLAMTATTFLTQRQLMAKNMPPDALTGPYAQQQKMLLYVLPVVFAVGGIAFPIGVLLYWTTSNLWTMGQQFYVIRNNPAPGTEAARLKEERDAKKAAARRPATSPPTADRDDDGGRGGARAGPAPRPAAAAQAAVQEPAPGEGAGAQRRAESRREPAQPEREEEREQAVSEQTDERHEIEPSAGRRADGGGDQADEADEPTSDVTTRPTTAR